MDNLGLRFFILARNFFCRSLLQPTKRYCFLSSLFFSSHYHSTHRKAKDKESKIPSLSRSSVHVGLLLLFWFGEELIESKKFSVCSYITSCILILQIFFRCFLEIYALSALCCKFSLFNMFVESFKSTLNRARTSYRPSALFLLYYVCYVDSV